MAGRTHRIGWLVIALVWVGAIVVAEWVTRRSCGFILADGRPVILVVPRVERETVAMETIGGQTIWRRVHPDRPTPSPRKEGFRIVVLGDSVLEPARVAERDGTARLLERELNDRLDRGPYEVVNLAEGGWNTLQEEQVLQRDGLPLAPDLVLVGVTPNDLQEVGFVNGELYDVHYLRDLEERARPWPWRYVVDHSYLYNTAWLWWERAISANRNRDRPPEWQAIVAPLQRMQQAVRERSGELALWCFPQLVRDRLDPARDGCGFHELRGWVERDAIPMLDPAAAYARYATRDIRVDDIHLSPFGHRVLTAATFDWLVASRLVPYEHVGPRHTPGP